MARSMTWRLAWMATTIGAACLASATARAEDKPRVFALLVANNRSSTLSVPDLQYADDDGARYYRLFRGVTDGPNLALLANLDRASRRVYPELTSVAQAPTRPALERAVTALADEVRAANSRGEHTVFYFVYAGHGRVEGGRGYVELEDQSIDGDFIEHQIVERIPAEKKHLVLDSCNSFFVINPRKPGGRRWATPRDMALGFSARHPEVGLFLSTNSDSEVFEWSEIESGVFSHEVRSGLSGAADVNRDGKVSYAELAGFVEQANAGISRESLRPRLFYRGPQGDASAPLFATDGALGKRIALPNAETRLWLKNDSGERLLDLHKESGPMTVVVPPAAVDALTLFIQRAPARDGDHPTVVEQTLPAGPNISVIARSEGDAPLVAARGEQLFGDLFAKPYGQLAFAEYERQSADAPAPVYGVGEAELTRMHNYLSAMAAQGRYERLVGGTLYMGIGAIYGATAVVSIFDRPRPGFGLTLGALSAVSFGIGLYATLTPSTSEDAFATFEEELTQQRSDHSGVFARTEEKLQKVARRERLTRNIGFWAMESVGVATGAVLGVSLANRHNQAADERLAPSGYAALFTASGLFVVGGFLLRATDTPTERFLHLYQSDPGLKLQVGASAIPGGANFGVSGSF